MISNNLRQLFFYENLEDNLVQFEHTYNALNQLIDDGNAHYEYDLNGNLIKKTA